MYSFTVYPVFFADINECLVGASNCRRGERCINTEGSFRCQREVSCGTGYELTDSNNCKGLCCLQGDIDLLYFFGCYSQRVDRQFFCDVFIQILMSVRLVSITVDRSFNAKTPRGHSVVCPKFSVDLALSRMLLETVLVSISTKGFIVAKHPIQSSAATYDLYLSTCKDIEILKLLPSKCPHINVNFKIFNNMMTGICSLIN